MSAQATVVAVIPTYRPSSDVMSLVEVLSGCVQRILVSDDGSPCTSDPTLREMESTLGVSVLRHDDNRGIARGLNEGLSIARGDDCRWILTLDQDSVIDATYVADLVSIAMQRVADGEKLGALGAELIEDSSGTMHYRLRQQGSFTTTEEVIQTGSLWNVQALVDVGGFDTTLGMDGVDAGACLALRKAGYSIGVAAGLRVSHSIGDSRMIRIGRRSVMITGHSPERRASMVRSRLRLFPGEFAVSPRHAMRTLRRVAVNQFLGLIVEEQRWSKARGTIRGIRSVRSG